MSAYHFSLLSAPASSASLGGSYIFEQSIFAGVSVPTFPWEGKVEKLANMDSLKSKPAMKKVLAMVHYLMGSHHVRFRYCPFHRALTEHTRDFHDFPQDNGHVNRKAPPPLSPHAHIAIREWC